MEKWARASIRFRLPIVAIWLTLIILGIFTATGLNQRLTTSLTVPGSPSSHAETVAAKAFGENAEGTFTVFYKFGKAQPAQIQKIQSNIGAAVSEIPNAHVVQSRAIGGVLFTSIATPYNLPKAATYTLQLRSRLAAHGIRGALITGPPAIKSDVSPVLEKDLRHGQMLALLLGFILLVLALGISWAALVPIIFATSIIFTTLALIYLLSHKFLMVLYIPNIVELIGLGIAIDYSLLIVQRFRREVQLHDTETAIRKTMVTAGRTAMLSGVTVALGLATLMLVPIPFIRSLGLAGMLVPIVAMLGTLTLQPALLSYLGPAGVQTHGFEGLLNRVHGSRNFFSRLTRVIHRRPLSIFLGSLVAVAIALIPLLSLHVTPSSLTAIPHTLESSRALDLVTRSAGSGAITPSEIIVDLGTSHAAESFAPARVALANTISSDPEVFLVATGERQPYVDPTGQFLRMYVVGKHDVGAPETAELIKRMRGNYLIKTQFPSTVKFYLGGAPAQGSDLVHQILKSFPLILCSILFLTYLLLLWGFKSYVLPLKAIVLDLLSVSLALSTVIAVIHFGVGSSILGTYHLRDIEVWVVIFLFAVLFGLSMDYEVFIVSRIREAWDNNHSNEEAITEGITQTGGVVSFAAAILIVAVSGMAFGHFAGLQELGIGLVGGIALDATIIRGLLLPSAMVLLGKWNWIGPHQSKE